MNQEYLDFMAEYLDKIEEALEFDPLQMDYNRYRDNLSDIIVEIGNVFEKEIPEIKTSVILNNNSVDRDVDITIALIKKFLIKNNYKKISKVDNTIKKFCISFMTFFEGELPEKGLLKTQYISYDEWEQSAFALDIDYEYEYKLEYGIHYYECETLNDIKLFIELAFRKWIEQEKRYEFTKDVNEFFRKFKLPYKLQKGKIVKIGYKTTNLDNKIINYAMLERKIQFAEEMILSSESLDKKCALDYIIDSLQYIISIQEGKGTDDKYKSSAKKVTTDLNSKVYAVVKKEIKELMIFANEYFDIRHNEYLNNAKEKREPITDTIFIEYLYNRAYSLLYLLKIKQ